MNSRVVHNCLPCLSKFGASRTIGSGYRSTDRGVSRTGETGYRGPKGLFFRLPPLTCHSVTRARVFNCLTKSFFNGIALWITRAATPAARIDK